MKFFKITVYALVLFLLSFGTCLSQHTSLSYLALGDSYTIGEKVSEDNRWPVQLVDSLRAKGFHIDEPQIIAKTGWTTDELLEAINKAELNPPYDLVSLLIGVNNQYQGLDISQFRSEFKTLLEKSINLAGGYASRVIVVSIPDYGVTPFGQQKNSKKISEELKEYNHIAQNIATKNKVTFVNITPISKKAKRDSTLIAPDGLHPSGKMYQKWVSRILSHAIRKLK